MILTVLEPGPIEMAQTSFLHSTRRTLCSGTFKHLELPRKGEKNASTFLRIFAQFSAFFLRRGTVYCQSHLAGMTVYDPALARRKPASIRVIAANRSLPISTNSSGRRLGSEFHSFRRSRPLLSAPLRNDTDIHKYQVTIQQNVKEQSDRTSREQG